MALFIEPLIWFWVLKVDEEGAEAAGATVMEVRKLWVKRRKTPPPPIPFVDVLWQIQKAGNIHLYKNKIDK